ncbi:MAG: hypothetical protein FGM15_01560 [Chthoniobacterales bacterium]|nr:hypothetical protein [Chthoniobacterales bacterium]
MTGVPPHRPGALLPRLLLFALLAALFAPAANAQVRVDISFKRKLYVLYEPLIATVTINNLSGRPLLLEDVDDRQWFGFSIETDDGRPVPPINARYSLAPAAVGPGEKMTRAVNITPLFPLHEFGLYRIKATVYADTFGRYFSSPPLAVEITDGRPIWQEVVGVPGPDGRPELRTVTLLSHKLSRTTRLYARIEDKENGRVYATHQLGQFLTFGRPEVMLDVNNEIHILQNSSPKQFLYTHLGLQGEVLARQAYVETGKRSRPSLVKQDGGSVAVVGGRPYTPGEEEQIKAEADKVGDRPVPLPEP